MKAADQLALQRQNMINVVALGAAFYEAIDGMPVAPFRGRRTDFRPLCKISATDRSLALGCPFIPRLRLHYTGMAASVTVYAKRNVALAAWSAGEVVSRAS